MSDAWLYLRKSRTKEEMEDPEVLSRHRSALLRLAADDGVAISPERIYQEVQSGESIQLRPVFSRLLEELTQRPRNSGGLLYVMDVDRLSRGDQAERGKITEILHRIGIVVRLPGGHIDLSDPDAELLYEIKGSLARNELAKYKRRVAAAMHEKVLAGEIRYGRVPFGYRWDRNLKQPVPDGENFEILKLLCEDALTHSRVVLAERYCLPEWVIQKALMSPMICGWPAHCYRKIPNTKRMERLPPEEWTWPEKQGDYPAAITREEWDRLQEVIHRRYRAREKAGSSRGWCRDVVQFRGYERGAKMGSLWNGQGRVCHTYEITPHGIPRRYIDRELVHQAAEAAIRSVIANEAVMRQRIKAYLRTRGTPEKRSSKADAAKARHQLAEFRQKYDILFRREIDLEAGGAAAEEMAAIGRLRSEISRSIERAKAELLAANERHAIIPAVDQVARYLEGVQQWEAIWNDGMTDEERRVLANGFIQAIDVVIEPIAGREGNRRRFRREVAGVRMNLRE